MRLPRFPEREVIGAPACPLLHRWTLHLGGCKLMLHHFMPKTTDPDIHDHPWPFWILVLRGSYDDIVPCPKCKGERVTGDDGTRYSRCYRCAGSGTVLGEVMRAPKLRRRGATHMHRTRTYAEGAWTVVLTGPKRRPWGFWRDSRWWPFKAYEERFGFVMRCEERETSIASDLVRPNPGTDRP